MKILGFRAKIKRAEYKSAENKRSTSEDDKLVYYVQALIAEVKRGRSHYESRHNITLYMTKEQFDGKALSVGDIIEVSDGVNFAPSLFNFNLYDPEKIKGFAAKSIKTDTNGRPYVPQKVFAYHIVAPIGTWGIDTKFSEMYYWQFGSLKIPMDDGETADECEAQFKNETQYAFYLDENEYDKVKEYDGDYVLNGYKRSTLTIKQPFHIAFERNESIGKWKVTLTKIEV